MRLKAIWTQHWQWKLLYKEVTKFKCIGYCWTNADHKWYKMGFVFRKILRIIHLKTTLFDTQWLIWWHLNDDIYRIISSNFKTLSLTYIFNIRIYYFSLCPCHVFSKSNTVSLHSCLLFFSLSCFLSKYRPSQLCAAWFHCLYRLSAQAISLCSAFMGNLGLLGVQSLGEICLRNTGRQFNNAADSWEKPGIYLL